MNYFLRFQLNISYDQYLSVYQGKGTVIRTRSEDGRIIEFPAIKVQPFLDHQGVRGVFEMELSDQNKFIGIKKI